MSPFKMTEHRRAYMREYMGRPDQKAKKAARDVLYYAENRDRIRARATNWYRNNTAAHHRRVRKAAEFRGAYIDSIRASGCVDCGNKNLAVLQSDHVRGRKAANIGSLRGSFARIDAELAKCETRCANCHAIVTAARRKARAA